MLGMAALAAAMASPAAFGTDPHTGAKATVTAATQARGNVGIGANGSAVSGARNTEAASAVLHAHRSHAPDYSAVGAGVRADLHTGSRGHAFNMSSGSAAGTAMTAGAAEAKGRGVIGIEGVSTGFNGGHASIHTDNVVEAGRNQGSYVDGKAAAGFDAAVLYRNAGGIHLSGTSGGYAAGTNASGALPHMNAAGIAELGSSVRFFSSTQSKGTAHAGHAP
jgi:hypothetical protein